MRVPISLIILLLFATTCKQSFAQKNTVKGMVGFIPVPTLFGFFVSAGYERNISAQSTIELGGFYLLNTDEMGTVYHNYAIMPAYKYYFSSESKFINNIWLSVYGLYIYSTHVHTHEENFRCKSNYLGGGLSIGKRLFLNKTKLFFMDIGFGLAFTNRQSTDSNGIKNTQKNIPRPILQFGWKF